MAEAMLVVVRPFAGFKTGALIDNVADISKILGGEHVHDVVRVAAPRPPALLGGEK
jgi:hypothetical protein